MSTQSALRRSSLFYYATSATALVIEQIEILANETDLYGSKAEATKKIASYATQILQSLSILEELSASSDLSPQARANLSIWKAKVHKAKQMVEKVLAILG